MNGLLGADETHSTSAQWSLMTSPVQEETPRVIGKYPIIGTLGHGGTSKVYRGRDPDLGRDVAIKILNRNADGDLIDAYNRLRREAIALARLQHDNIVPVHEIGQHNGRLFIVLDWVDGKVLDKWIQEDEPTRERLLEAVLLAGRGLSAVHHAGLVHRDFKPQNIMIDREGRVRVLDFGLVTMLEVDGDQRPSGQRATNRSAQSDLLAVSITRTAHPVGTAQYMAPERLDGESVPSPLEDQFSFGVTLYEALYRQNPFEGTTFEEVRLRRAPWRPSLPAGAAHDRIWPIIARSLAHDPSQRFSSVDELLDAMESAMRPDLRRRRWSVVTILLLLSASMAVFLWLRPSALDRCQERAESIGEVWTEAYPNIPASLRSSDVLETAIQKHTDQWEDAYLSTCNAAYVEADSLNRDQIDRRSSCLESGRREFEALVKAFTRADISLKEALLLIEHLPNPIRCLEDATLGLLPRPPQNQLSEIARIESALGSIKVEAIGDLASAVEQARELAQDAERTKHLPVVVKSNHILGDLLRQSRALEDARSVLEDAKNKAESIKDDETVLRILESEILVQIHNRKAEEALTLKRFATAKWKRIFPTETKRIREREYHAAILERYAGLIAYEKAQYKQAVTHHNNAITLWKKFVDDESTSLDLAIEYHSLGRARSDTPDFVQGRADYEQALAIYQRVLGQSHPDVFSIRYNLAIDDYERGKMHRAQESFTKLKDFDSSSSDCTNHKYKLDFMLALVALQRGAQAQALERTRATIDCIVRLESAPKSMISATYNILAEVYIDGAEVALARQALAKARDLLRPTDYLDYGTLHIVDASIELKANNPEQALEALSDAEDTLDRGELSALEPRRAELELRRGDAYTALARDEDALAAFERAIGIISGSGLTESGALKEPLETLAGEYDKNCDNQRLCIEMGYKLARTMRTTGNRSDVPCVLTRRALDRSENIGNQIFYGEIDTWRQGEGECQ